MFASEKAPSFVFLICFYDVPTTNPRWNKVGSFIPDSFFFKLIKYPAFQTLMLLFYTRKLEINWPASPLTVFVFISSSWNSFGDIYRMFLYQSSFHHQQTDRQPHLQCSVEDLVSSASLLYVPWRERGAGRRSWQGCHATVFRLLQRRPDRAVSCLTPAGLPEQQTKECIFCDFLDTFIDQGGDYRRNTHEYALANTASGKVWPRKRKDTIWLLPPYQSS